jgi:hypothetical protein
MLDLNSVVMLFIVVSLHCCGNHRFATWRVRQQGGNFEDEILAPPVLQRGMQRSVSLNLLQNGMTTAAN